MDQSSGTPNDYELRSSMDQSTELHWPTSMLLIAVISASILSSPIIFRAATATINSLSGRSTFACRNCSRTCGAAGKRRPQFFAVSEPTWVLPCYAPAAG
ncbi:hypothetical protein BC832DRAFT_551142 [Gaertneriomyces semiglobifer]|nr:hypothetical protein BC832DRAFT_551142 [Gaertneriomyces semiglobifer]